MPFLSLNTVDVASHCVLVRLDLNMPLNNGKITDFSRLEASFKTIATLCQNKAKVIILTHLGRPKGYDTTLSFKPLIAEIQQFLHLPMSFAETLDDLQKQAITLQPGSILFFDNLRFYAGEEKNDPSFAKELKERTHATLYVNDAFSVSHRAHASVYALPKLMPTVIAGYGLLEEIKHLTTLMTSPKRPFAAIIGGSKVSTKLPLLNSLLTKVEVLFLGGAMATTFLIAQKKLERGKSLYEENFIEVAQDLLDRNAHKIILPTFVTVKTLSDHTFSYQDKKIEHVLTSDVIIDVAEQAIFDWKNTLETAQTIVWNGPVGIFEETPGDQGSHKIAELLAFLTKQKGIITLAGGGDTLACLGHAKKDLSYVSTAGGAFLEWLEGKKLPGIDVLNRDEYQEQVQSPL